MEGHTREEVLASTTACNDLKAKAPKAYVVVDVDALGDELLHVEHIAISRGADERVAELD